MWVTILTTLLPVLAKLGLMYLDWIKANEKQKEKFLDFLKEMEPHNQSCMCLREDYMMQRKAILEKRKKKKK